MNLLSLAIKYLLQNEKLPLKGLGNLFIQYVPSQFEEQKGTFLPPSKKIIFSSEEQDIASVVEFISKGNSISTEEAQRLWIDFCHSVETKLKQEKYYEFGDLGTLKLLQNEVFFETNIDLLEENFGFSTLQKISISNTPITPNIGNSKEENIQEEEQIEETKEINQTTEENSTAFEDIEDNSKEKDTEEEGRQDIEKAEINSTEENTASTEEKNNGIEEKPLLNELKEDSLPYIIEKPRKRRNIFWPILTIFLVLILATVCYWCFVHPNCPYLDKVRNYIGLSKTVEGNRLASIDTDTVVAPVAVEPTDDINEIAVISQKKPGFQSKPAQETLASSRSYSDSDFQSNSKQGIDIICAFFKDGHQASVKCKSMRERGYNAYVIVRGNNRFYVSLGSFAKKDDAINFMRDTYNKDRMDLFLQDWNKKH